MRYDMQILEKDSGAAHPFTRIGNRQRTDTDQRIIQHTCTLSSCASFTRLLFPRWHSIRELMSIAKYEQSTLQVGKLRLPVGANGTIRFLTHLPAPCEHLQFWPVYTL
jgi:hypothetical protein